jgi:alkylhydroperoxidase family enzyme
MNDMIGPGAAPETQVARIALVKPSQAAPEVAAVYADIKASKGTKFLTPTWGFFAHDPELLQLWWGLQKRLQKNAGEVPKKVMLGIMFVCASEIGCPRCINNAQVQLQDQFGLSDAEIQDLADFEACDRISAAEKAVYRFCLKAAFDRPTSAEDFAALRAAGYTDRAIVEMISLTILESGFIRRARALAPFEDGADWPRENLPSAVYAHNVDSKRK